MTRCVLNMAMIQMNREWLQDTMLEQIMKKLPEWTVEQRRCGHRTTKLEGSQWFLGEKCRDCGARIRYQPTSRALRSAIAKKAEARSFRRRRPAAAAGMQASASGSSRVNTEMATAPIAELVATTTAMQGALGQLAETVGQQTQIMTAMAAQTQAMATWSSRMEAVPERMQQLIVQATQASAQELATQMTAQTEGSQQLALQVAAQTEAIRQLMQRRDA